MIGEKAAGTKSLIAQYIAECGATSKNDIAKRFGLSMPTVLQKVRELTAAGIVTENGEYESTGGRRAAALSIVAGRKYAVGVNISRNHLEMVLVSLDGGLVYKERSRFAFSDSDSYGEALGAAITGFVNAHLPDSDRLMGVGVSVPGILDRAKALLVRSHILGLENFSLKRYSARIPYRVLYDNDANCAAHSEPLFRLGTAIFLSLNNTLGGAFSVGGKLYPGSHRKSAEFGHVILVPDGAPCYCGKRGCADSYCSAQSLTTQPLEQFFLDLKAGKPESQERWQSYLRYLAVLVSNLRTVYDCEIILGGYVGGYLQDYLPDLGDLTMQYNSFDYDASYLHCGRYNWEASAYGAALKMLKQYFAGIQ